MELSVPPREDGYWRFPDAAVTVAAAGQDSWSSSSTAYVVIATTAPSWNS